MTIDVAVFDEDSPRAGAIAKALLREGKGSFGAGERLANEFMQQIKHGHIEIDEVRSVEDHSA